jgi:molybdopterin-guanine dinucleotide biosynthesis protein A
MRTVVLTGGKSKRFGSDKSHALINNRTLLEYVTDGLDDLIIVGPETSIPAFYIQEEPLGGGPVLAIGAALKHVDSDLVAIFATDMPFAPRVIPQLLQALINDAALPIDCEGFAQPLAGIYRTEPLQNALNSLDNLENQSMKMLVGKLKVDLVPLVETELLMDIDTQEDLVKAIDLASRLAP